MKSHIKLSLGHIFATIIEKGQLPAQSVDTNSIQLEIWKDILMEFMKEKRMFNVNFVANFFLVQILLPLMLDGNTRCEQFMGV